MKTELVWEGKYDEYGNRRPVKLPTTPLPLQRIERIDAPCDAAKARTAQPTLGSPAKPSEARPTTPGHPASQDGHAWAAS